MKPNRYPTTVFSSSNLLHDLGFLLQLKFEVRYAASVRGGHAPLYLNHRSRRQLVQPARIPEKKVLIKTIAAFPVIIN